jgi:hypothetical protein
LPDQWRRGGITGRDGTTWHVHLTASEARLFLDYIDDRT